MEKQRSTEGPPSVLTEFEVKKSANLCRLNWLQNLYGVEPQWDAEPDMEIIEETVSAVLREALPVGLDDPQIYPIEFFAQGALNKVFLIPTKDKDFIVRVTLPVDPMWKTLSEVSTLEWIRENTSLPVPDILHYDHTRENPIHYEYMVMTRVIGTTLADRWVRMSSVMQQTLVQRLANYCAETFRHKMRGIGNLYSLPIPDIGGSDNAVRVGYITMTSHTPKKPAKLHCVSRIVSGPFFVEDRIYDDVFRGPFFSSKDWLTTRLTLAENECRRQIERISKASEKRKDMLRMVHSHDSDLASESEDSEEDDAEEIYRTLRIIERLMARLDDFFPPNDIGVATEPEHSMLFHYDLSSHNILVDDDGNLTGVVDWECVSILPLWAACRVPAFLEGRIVDKEPSKAHFGLAEDEELEGNDDAALYLENLRYYHVTLLRRLFLDKMREIEPNWVQVYEASERQRDFDFAVSSCDDGLIMRRIENWLDDMDAGSKNVKGLQQRMEDGTL